MLEREIEKQVCKYAINKGFLVHKTTSIGNRGFPDREFTHPTGLNRDGGFTFLIEFKSTDGNLTLKQEDVIKKLRKCDRIVYVVNSFEKGKDIIDHHILNTEEFYNNMFT